MAGKGTFNERRDAGRDEIVGFFGTFRGLVFAAVVVVGVIGFIIYDIIKGLG